jgi:hypothetical protein
MKTKNTLKIMLISLLMILTGIFLVLPQFLSSPVAAQVTYQTPTPGADGRILYTVQEGDNCTRIFLLTGVTIDQIIALNALDQDCAIYPGNQILLGTVEPPSQEETTAPTVNPVEITPSPTLSPGFAELCVVLFEDIDGTGMRTENELYLAGGEVSLNNRLGTVSKTGATVGGDPELVEPLCFEEIPEGEYNITIGIPDGYNATTITNYALTLKAGSEAMLDFGAQVSTNIGTSQEITSNGGRSPVLGIVGGLVLLGGLGLGIYLWRARKV